MAKRTRTSNETAANIGYEAHVLQMADALRGSMDAAEYKHVCSGLLFLKYITDAFEEKRAARVVEMHEPYRGRVCQALCAPRT